ncbi:helix-turn-helix domain-containing protein [Virgibacillus siamensis]|uniref:helix-turn-helix domain-containing protein n=1 Tax=Virgibacillus siamensis TaxID=480071 RepID=UPI0009840BCC|nr:helix-turn-helix transcriptional regulator [Virgibacillus siamensis]
MKLGEKLKMLRDMHGLTMREVAERADVHFTYIGKIEHGAEATMEVLRRLCDIYGVEMSFLFNDPDNEMINGEWLKFIKEMEEQEMTPDDVRNYIQVVKTIRGLQ